MRFPYQFTNLLGCVYRTGNLLFSSDGDRVISPVGNRISVFDLKNDKSETLPIESRYNFTTIALSPNGSMLCAVNEMGEAYICNLLKRVVLHRHHFKRSVKSIKFSPDGKYIAFTKENNVFVFRAPNVQLVRLQPFCLERVFHSAFDDTLCLDWSSDSKVLAVGSKDLTTKIYAMQKFSNFSMYTLGSHTDNIIACYFKENSLDMYTISKNDQLCIWKCNVDLEGLIPITEKIKSADSNNECDETEWNQHTDSMDTSEKVYYTRSARYNLKDGLKTDEHVTLCSAAYHRGIHILATGFSNGSFLLHDLPECNLIHSLSISKHSISSLSFNCTGDWIAIGCSSLGQLIVWEWQSESFVMKQQSHFNNMSCLAYSSDGQYIATGGDDGKLKVWNPTSGFCFVTFTEHKSKIVGVAFTHTSKVIVSASLDGTLRAFDLHRYRNFRTCTSPKLNQFTSLAVDHSGEIVCAGTEDSFEIFVWSLQTGKLLDILAGHEAPVSSLCFSPCQSVLVSGSWDKSVRIWDVFETKGSREIIPMTSDVLAVQFRPDGREIAVSTLDGQISFFDLASSTQTGSIDSRDLEVGRKGTDLITPQKLQGGVAFTTLYYTADGRCLLAAGKSKNICVYYVKQQILLKRYEITCNHSFDGMDDFISRRKMTPFGNKALIEERDDNLISKIQLPGVRKGEFAERCFKPEVLVSGIAFCPTARAWAVCTTEGLLIYSVCNNVFDPYELEIGITDSTVQASLKNGDFSQALVMALRLNVYKLIVEVIESIPSGDVKVIAQYMPQIYVERLLNFLSIELETTRHIQFYLIWTEVLFMCHGIMLKERSSKIMPMFCRLQTALTKQEEELSKLDDYSYYKLSYTLIVGYLKQIQQAKVEDTIDENDTSS